jgi:hypothetical protein
MRVFHRGGHGIVFGQVRQVIGTRFAGWLNEYARGGSSGQLYKTATGNFAQGTLLTNVRFTLID